MGIKKNRYKGGIKSNYKIYTDAYKQKQHEQANKGYNMAYTMLKDWEFDSMYNATKNTYQLEDFDAVIAKMVESDAYVAGEAQARNLHKAVSEYNKAFDKNIQISIEDFRAGTEESQLFIQMIEDEREALMGIGITSGEASKIIAQRYFGSK